LLLLPCYNPEQKTSLPCLTFHRHWFCQYDDLSCVIHKQN
jgi:hypothetical protein